MKVLLINASAPEFNLAVAKQENYWRARGAEVAVGASVPTLLQGDAAFDLVWVSAIFSWHVPALIEAARQAQSVNIPVEVGGPGTFGLRETIYRETGLLAQATPDTRFERQSGKYRAVFWSRGCPAKNCSLGFPRDGRAPVCSVPEMEGWKFTLYTDVEPAPVILDNNLSALPKLHQELIIERTLACDFEEVDANSGFEPRSFKLETALRWNRLPLKAWRFAYDETAERPAVLRMMAILDEIKAPKKMRHIYCLAGNEPVEACEQRVLEIQKWGAVPIVQRRRPLDWMGDPSPLPCLFDWTPQRLIDFQRWGNRLSGAFPFSKYKRGLKDRDILTEPLVFV